MPSEWYLRDKHRRFRSELGLDPAEIGRGPALQPGTRVVGIKGGIRNRTGTVYDGATWVLPPGQFIVRFDDPVVSRGGKIVAVVPGEVEPI